MQRYTITVSVYEYGNVSVIVSDNNALKSSNGDKPYIIYERNQFSDPAEAFRSGYEAMIAHKAASLT